MSFLGAQLECPHCIFTTSNDAALRAHHSRAHRELPFFIKSEFPDTLEKNSEFKLSNRVKRKFVETIDLSVYDAFSPASDFYDYKPHDPNRPRCVNVAT